MHKPPTGSVTLMLAPSVKIVERDYSRSLVVDGVGELPLYEDADDATFIGPIEVAARAGLSVLRRALIAHANEFELPRRHTVVADGKTITLTRPSDAVRARLQFVDVPAAKFRQRHSYEFAPEPIEVVLREDDRLQFVVEHPIEGEREPSEAALTSLVEPVLRSTNAAVAEIEAEPHGVTSWRTNSIITNADFWIVRVYLDIPLRGRQVEIGLNLGRDVIAVLDAAENGTITDRSARALVDAGRAELLIGRAECATLECKSIPYAVSDVGRLEFCKDVSAFLNASGGGLILIGVQTRKHGGKDVISRLRPIPMDAKLPQRYRGWIDRTIFPRPDGIEVHAVAYGSASIVAITIPEQRTAIKPFLVRGIVEGEKVVGNYISIFERRDDRVVPLDPQELHSLLIAGRVALKIEDDR